MKKKKFKYLFYGATALAGGFSVAKYIGRSIINRISDKSTKTIMTDEYGENMWEFVSAGSRIGIQNIVELNLRSESGQIIERPLGSPKTYPSVQSLLFPFAQIDNMPIPVGSSIDTSTIIGKKAKRPLYLKTPLIIAGMAYGFALSEPFRLALAKGSSLVGTAFNSGQSGFLPKERQAADKIIQQYTRGHWGKKPKTLSQADGIELHFGQGGVGGLPMVLEPNTVSKRMREQFEVKKGEKVIYHSRIPGIDNPQDLIRKVRELRSITDGIPIGAKIGAGDGIEQDLYWILEAGLDFVNICGNEAGSKGVPPVLQDDFGLPTLYAITRAINYLEKENARKEIDIILAGKLITPGDFLKAIALGADAVCIGTAALFATAHTEVLKSLPFEPPTQIAWMAGKQAARFDIEKGANNLAQYINSCTEEMKMALTVMGKTSHKQLSEMDLVAVDSIVAEITGIRSAHLPPF